MDKRKLIEVHDVGAVFRKYPLKDPTGAQLQPHNPGETALAIIEGPLGCLAWGNEGVAYHLDYPDTAFRFPVSPIAKYAADGRSHTICCVATGTVKLSIEAIRAEAPIIAHLPLAGTVRQFGARLERNFSLLRGNIENVCGLDPKDYHPTGGRGDADWATIDQGEKVWNAVHRKNNRALRFASCGACEKPLCQECPDDPERREPVTREEA